MAVYSQKFPKHVKNGKIMAVYSQKFPKHVKNGKIFCPNAIMFRVAPKNEPKKYAQKYNKKWFLTS